MGYRVAGEACKESEIADANAVKLDGNTYAGKAMSPARFAAVCAIAAAISWGFTYAGGLGIGSLYAIQVVYSMSLALFAIFAYRNIRTVKCYGGISASIFTFSIVSLAMVWLGVNGILSAVIAFFVLAKNRLI